MYFPKIFSSKNSLKVCVVLSNTCICVSVIVLQNQMVCKDDITKNLQKNKWSNYFLLRVKKFFFSHLTGKRDLEILEKTQKGWLTHWKDFLSSQPLLTHEKWNIFQLTSFKGGIHPGTWVRRFNIPLSKYSCCSFKISASKRINYFNLIRTTSKISATKVLVTSWIYLRSWNTLLSIVFYSSNTINNI